MMGSTNWTIDGSCRRDCHGLKSLLITVCALLLATSQMVAAQGIIDGIVINGTTGNPVGENIEVVLRVELNGELVTVGQTVTDPFGSFQFVDLPDDHTGTYLPGANLDGVHFPGTRLHIRPGQSRLPVRLVVFDAVREPTPLVIDSHEITIEAVAEGLRVRETMVIRNPSQTCYIGSRTSNDNALSDSSDLTDITLTLSIPSNFQRLTFDQEAFGRRFQLIDGQVFTGIPWPPGVRELAYTYVLPRTNRQEPWQRVIDLPTKHFHVHVRGEMAEHARSNLSRGSASDEHDFEFAASSDGLAAGFEVNVSLDAIPVGGLSHQRLAALSLLVGSVAIVGGSSAWRRRYSPKSSRLPHTGRNGQKNCKTA